MVFIAKTLIEQVRLAEPQLDAARKGTDGRVSVCPQGGGGGGGTARIRESSPPRYCCKRALH